MDPHVLPLHLGAMHPFEQALTFALAFGPFVVLAVVIVVRRRTDRAAEARAAGSAGSAGSARAAGAATDADPTPDALPQRER